MKPVVALVGTESPGNVGVVARAMKNFGFTELLLVDPPAIKEGDEAHGFAGQADDVLGDARRVEFEELVSRHHTVGFTAEPGSDPSSHLRYPVTTPEQLRDDLGGVEPLALVFGRERVGLTNHELERVDRVATIPANPGYASLNLGQAVTVVLYELRGLALNDDHLPARRSADPGEVEEFHELFRGMLRDVGHQEETRHKTERLMRRLFGRADPTPREVRTLKGVVRRVREAVGDG